MDFDEVMSKLDLLMRIAAEMEKKFELALDQFEGEKERLAIFISLSNTVTDSMIRKNGWSYETVYNMIRDMGTTVPHNLALKNKTRDEVEGQRRGRRPWVM